MAKIKKNEEKKGFYFREREEQAVKDYLKTTDKKEKEEIYNTILYPAFTKMVESIIRRYKLYPPDEEYEETFNDTMSFLLTKIDCFNPDSGFKAYSYCGTICKNYLIFKISQYVKNRNRSESFDVNESEYKEDIRYAYDTTNSQIETLNEIISSTIEEINTIMSRKEKYKLSENEMKVGMALNELMGNWEDLFAKMGSNKFNKSAILLYLRETTLLTTQEIRNSMKKYKQAYMDARKNVLSDIYG